MVKTRRPSVLKVESELFQVLLYQIVPGEEATLAKTVVNGVFGDQAQVFVALSEFDLVAIIPNPRLPLTFDHHCSVARQVRDVQETLAFRWTQAAEFNSFFNYKGPAVALTFVKLNAAVINQRGLYVERDLLDYLKTQLPRLAKRGVAVYPLGTLGWSEVLLIWHADSYKVITEEILHLRTAPLSDLPLTLNRPLITDTHTIPCAYLSGPADFDRPYAANSLAQIQGVIHPTISIASNFGYHTAIIDALQKAPINKSLQIEATFGYYDLSISPQTNDFSVSDLASLIGFIRDPNKCPGVLSTQIILAELPPGAPRVTPLKFDSTSLADNIASYFPDVLERLVDVETKQANPFRRFAPNLTQIVTSFLSANASGEMDGLTDDLFPFVEEMLKKADQLSTIPSLTEQSAIYEALEDVHLLYKFGFDQRLTGVQVGLANAARASTALRPIGLQRILGAVSSIPRHLLQHLPQVSWKGFVVFGYAPYAVRLDEGVFSIPINDLLDPARWWFLNHEVGHELFVQLELSLSPGFQNAIERYCQESKVDMRNRETHALFAAAQIDELVAELFFFVTACSSDWHFFLNGVWDFFQYYLDNQATQSKIEEYLLRSLFVLTCHLERQGALGSGETLAGAILNGKKLEGHILLPPEEDSPSYSVYNYPNVDKNLSYRGFAEYDSIADLIDKEIINPIIKVCPRLSSNLRAIDSAEVARLYTIFEGLRSEIIRVVNQLVPPSKAPASSSLTNLLRNILTDPADLRLSARESKLWKRLSAGEILIEEKVAPHELTALLKRKKLIHRHKPIDEKERSRAFLSVILSLWHMDKQIDRLAK